MGKKKRERIVADPLPKRFSVFFDLCAEGFAEIIF